MKKWILGLAALIAIPVFAQGTNLTQSVKLKNSTGTVINPATQDTLDDLNNKVTAVNTGAVTVTALPSVVVTALPPITATTPLPVISSGPPIRDGQMTSGSVTVSTSAVQIAPSYVSRRMVEVTNNGLGDLYLGFGSNVTTSGSAMGHLLRPGQRWRLDGVQVSVSSIWGIYSMVATGQNVVWSELRDPVD